MLPADTPKLPKWPFLVGDAALLGLAWLIGDQSRNPFAGTALVSIVICVVCGAVLAAVPFLADYARRQDEALDERQRGLEALSRTVAASAEQIGIAANGLHEIVEVAQRNLKTAEQLPARLQEKIGAIKIQAEPPRETRDTEKDDLKKEVARLRAADAERLQSATDKLVKAAAELSKLASARSAPAEAPAPPPVQVVAAPSAPARETAAVAREDSPASPPAGEAVPPPPAPPKRPRKPRPETSDANATPVADVSPAPKAEPEPAPIPVATIPEVVPVAPDSHTPFTPPAEAPVPEASHAPASTEPPTPEATPASIPAPAPAPVPAAAAEAVKPERKRAPRKPRPEVSAAAPATATTSANTNAQIPDDEPTLNLGDSSPEPESASASAPAERNERSVSSDGATRLLVTAYIGIGNRLFIRGSGPGLRWDKGLPLQFVSIGKWRWETNDATAPVQFKLYKNDDSECASLGTQTLDPGQQEEVTATF